jgi:hypothetical protein
MAGPLGLAAAWQALAGHPPGTLPYALVGFRLDALQVLVGRTDPPLDERLGRLGVAALGSALVVVLPLAVAGVVALRRDAVTAAAAAAWLGAGGAAVLAGGSYWAHYLIQLVPAGSVLAAVALARARRCPRAAVAALVVATVAAVNAAEAVSVRARTPQALERAAATFVRDHVRPGDTQYVLYARANVLYYVDLPSPYPYAWSLMLHAIPGATERLQRLLATERRPTWILQWQPVNEWGLDPDRRTGALLDAHYRRVAPSLCGRPVHVWLRRDDDRAVRRRPRVCPPFPPAGAGRDAAHGYPTPSRKQRPRTV